VNDFGVGGTERQFANLVRNHDRQLFEPHIACLRRRGAFLDVVEELDCPIVEYPVTSLRRPGALPHQYRLYRYLRKHRIDIVHGFGFYGNFFSIPVAKAARVPVAIASVRDIGAAWSGTQREVEKWCCHLADGIVTNAEAVKERVSSLGVRNRKIAVVGNGVDIERFSRPERGASIRVDLSIPDDAIVVGTISRIEWVKGLEFFIEASAIVARRSPKAWFLVVGDALPNEKDQAYKRAVQSRARELGMSDRVVFAGFRDDVPAILAELSVSVLPSLSEGLPNAVLESMAAGVCVVATDVGGTSEVVEDGVTGLLVPPKDPERMAHAILEAIGNPSLSRDLAQAGRERVERTYSLDRMARSMERCYLSLLATKRPGSRLGIVSGEHPTPDPSSLEIG
jgi:glycosyltransferase involved in cell wall biosynthesis